MKGDSRGSLLGLDTALYGAGGVTASLGLLALIGWMQGMPRLAALGPRLIPMPPSTAVLFLLFGFAIGLRARPPLGRRVIRLSAMAGGLIAVVASGLFVLAARNIHSDLEHLGFSITATMDGVPIGHMSPVSALCFLLASLSYLLSLAPLTARSWRAWAALSGAVLVLGVSFVFLLSYCFGTPLLYGGALIPPALSTILAFTVLGLALLRLADISASPRRKCLTAPPLWLATVALGAMSVIAAGYFYYHSFEQQYRRQAERVLVSIGELKMLELAQWHRERKGDGLVLSRNPAFSTLVRRGLALPQDESAIQLLKTVIGNYQEAYGYDQWRLLDIQCATRFSMPGELPPLTPIQVQSAAAVLHSGQPSLMDFDHDDDDRHPHLSIQVPLFDDLDAHQPLGVLILRIDPATDLYPYIQRWPTPSATAETLIVRRDDGDVLYLSSLRFRPNADLALRTSLTRTDIAEVQAALGQTGIIQAVDYRGVPVLAAAFPVPYTPWVLVAKIDSAEVDAPLRERIWGTILLVGVLLIGGGAVAGLFWRQRRERHLVEQLAAADALRESNELFSLYMQHSPIHTYIKSVTPTENRMLYASENLAQTLGLRASEMFGRTMSELFPAEFASKIMADDWTVISSGQVLQMEETFSGRHYSTIKFPIIQGGRNLLAGYSIDITTRKLEEAQLRLRGAALEAAANAIVITDREGTIEWANSAFSALTGWSLPEVIGKNPRVLVKSGEHDAAFYRQMWDTILAGKVWRGEVVNRRKDGKLRTEEMTITPLRDEQGTISHFIAIKQDITDHKTMETHFLQAQRMEAIGTLAGGVAHDLNNILAPVTIIAGLLKARLSDQDDRNMLAIAQDSVRRGTEIIKQLLAFSRGQEGERSIVQPRHLLNEMGRLMSETFPRDIALHQQISADLWPVNADPTQLHQVLMNLCVNARDAMPAGGSLTVAASNATLPPGDPTLPLHATPGPYVVIAIGDTGCGISPETRHRIFDPFFTTKPPGKGTGLGLSTVLGLVQHHGGFVGVDTTPHKGSTFTVYLPAVPEETVAAPTIQAPTPHPASGGHTILVVDDERNVRDSVRLLLEAEKYRVFTASHGEDALIEYIRHRDTISLVVTDLMMPEMSGSTLIRALRAIDPSLKIIAMSGLAELPQGEDIEAYDILMKPFEGPILLEAVRRRLAATDR